MLRKPPNQRVLDKLAHNGLAGRGELRRVSPSFEAGGGGLCTLHRLNAPRAAGRGVTLRALCAAAFALLLAPTAPAQLATLSEITDELSRSGFAIYGFSVVGSYSNTRGPVLTSADQLIADYSYHTYGAGVSTSIGWRTRTASKFHFDIRLTPSYMYAVSSTGFTGHSFTPANGLTANWGDTIGARWTLNGSLSASLGNFNQLLLSPNAQQILTGTPGTSADFGQTLVTGASANTELTTAANSAQSVLQGQENLLYGGFLLSASLAMNASYVATPRMHVSFGASGSRTQNLPDPFVPQTAFLLNQTTTINGNVSVGYKVSERTSASVSLTYGRPISSLYTTSTATVNLGLSRRLTEHWFASGSLGVGYILPSHDGNYVQGFQRLGYQASFYTGYRLLRNSFMAGVSRYVSDSFGLASSGTVFANVGWYWSPVRGHWGVSAGASLVRLEGTSLANQGYTFNAAIRETVSRNAFASLGAAYSVASGFIGPNNIFYPRTQVETIQLSVGFRPYLGSPDVSRFAGP